MTENTNHSQPSQTDGTSTRKLDWQEVPQHIRDAIMYLEMRRKRHDQ